jgi:DNA-binding transcriptional LysR family regulator
LEHARFSASTIDEIEAFVSISRFGGFAHAAEALHRSRHAISRRIEMQEEQLRTPIFERVRGGGVVLTEAGRSLLLGLGTHAMQDLQRPEGLAHVVNRNFGHSDSLLPLGPPRRGLTSPE